MQRGGPTVGCDSTSWHALRGKSIEDEGNKELYKTERKRQCAQHHLNSHHLPYQSPQFICLNLSEASVPKALFCLQSATSFFTASTIGLLEYVVHLRDQGSLGSTTSGSTDCDPSLLLPPDCGMPSSGSMGSSPKAMLMSVNTLDA